MLESLLILTASLSSLAWLLTYFHVVVRKKKELPAVIISACCSLIFFAVAIINVIN